MSRRAGLLAAAPVTSPPAANIPRTPRSRRGHSPGVTNPHRIAWPFSSRDRRPLRRPQQAPARHYGELCRFLRCSVCQLSGSAQLSSGPGMSCYVLSCPCAPDLGADRAWDMRLMRCPMEVMSRDAYCRFVPSGRNPPRESMKLLGHVACASAAVRRIK